MYEYGQYLVLKIQVDSNMENLDYKTKFITYNCELRKTFNPDYIALLIHDDSKGWCHLTTSWVRILDPVKAGKLNRVERIQEIVAQWKRGSKSVANKTKDSTGILRRS